jgi:DNA-binding beta-propeller fold protein YncE
MRGLMGVVLVAAGCSSGTGVKFQATCVAGAPGAEALVPAGPRADGSVILPGGRRLTPAGKVLPVGGFPLAMRLLPGERYLVVTDGAVGNEALRLVDTQAAANTVVAKVDYDVMTGTSTDPALFYGLALTRDGKRLYVSDGGYDPVPPSVTDLSKHKNVVEVFDVATAPPALNRLDAQTIYLYFNGAGRRLPAGLALSADEQTIYVANQIDGTLAVVDLRPGVGYGAEIGRSPELGMQPYDVLVDAQRPVVYVSLWGGKMLSTGMFAEGVVAVDVSRPNAPMPAALPIATGKAAEAMLPLDGKIYVAAADGDQVSVIDPAGAASQGYPTAYDASGLYGSAPNALAADAARGRLYVANAGENAVQAFSLPDLRSLGRIPTAWYPTAVLVRSDGTLLIASAKGLGGDATDHSPGDNGLMQGVLQVVPPPSDAELAAGDAQVHDNLGRPRTLEVALTCTGTRRSFPLPADKGGPTPIEYVFLIVRENKTYDAVLGDLPNTNGKPELAIFGGDVTPNLHALATRFANLDNFYSNAEQSIQGHEWTTTSTSNDYVEKSWLSTWGRGTRSLAAYTSTGSGLDHLAMPLSKTIWQELDAAGIAYHNYGEATNIGGATNALNTNYDNSVWILDVNFPGIYFGLGIPDVEKIAYVNSNLQDRTFKLERFSYISLPNDHTRGTQSGYPTPASMIADNDEATGRFIDALSHSRYWGSSIVFVVEDDPSDGGDHVELHRSPCVVMSPWVKSGYTSSVHYDNPSLYRTINLLLGVGPMNQYDANAAAMYDIFSTKPDMRPFTFVPRRIPVQLNTADAPLAAESEMIDFSRPDTAPLGRILWKAMKGKDAEPPWGKRPVGFTRDMDD